MEFLGLTDIFGRSTAVNLKFITSILQEKEFCRIYLFNNGYVDVQESYNYIVNIINNYGDFN